MEQGASRAEILKTQKMYTNIKQQNSGQPWK